MSSIDQSYNHDLNLIYDIFSINLLIKLNVLTFLLISTKVLYLP